jgi:DNA-binding transcriptional MocR family regulator
MNDKQDNRRITVVPFRAATDVNLTNQSLRILMLICSYTDKNNMTFVSQQTLAKISGVTRQAITNQMAILRKFGYIEIINKAYKGTTTNTIKVLFNNPTDQVKEIINETKDNQEDIDYAGQQRIAKLMGNVFGKTQATLKQMPKSGQTMTVQKMKQDLHRAQLRKL